jgi:hypothetical protein
MRSYGKGAAEQRDAPDNGTHRGVVETEVDAVANASSPLGKRGNAACSSGAARERKGASKSTVPATPPCDPVAAWSGGAGREAGLRSTADAAMILVVVGFTGVMSTFSTFRSLKR